MVKVEAKTVWTPITKDGTVKPTAHKFVFKNTGTTTVFIDNQPVLKNGFIGDDSSSLVPMQVADKNIKFVRDKDYEIKFATHNNTGYDEPPYVVVDPTIRHTLWLVQTFYTITR